MRRVTRCKGNRRVSIHAHCGSGTGSQATGCPLGSPACLLPAGPTLRSSLCSALTCFPKVRPSAVLTSPHVCTLSEFLLPPPTRLCPSHQPANSKSDPRASCSQPPSSRTWIPLSGAVGKMAPVSTCEGQSPVLPAVSPLLSHRGLTADASAHQMCGFPTPSNFAQHQLGVLRFNSALTLSTWTEHPSTGRCPSHCRGQFKSRLSPVLLRLPDPSWAPLLC